jgi:hypothetical protein
MFLSVAMHGFSIVWMVIIRCVRYRHKSAVPAQKYSYKINKIRTHSFIDDDGRRAAQLESQPAAPAGRCVRAEATPRGMVRGSAATLPVRGLVFLWCIHN